MTFDPENRLNPQVMLMKTPFPKIYYFRRIERLNLAVIMLLIDYESQLNQIPLI